ncbi:hypothetical protein [Corynebacterium flavescens]|uniref:hypothetical protein n=1 Tax=Corynebacterium flavescens TaxID=28028 RepID=UPI003FD45017
MGTSGANISASVSADLHRMTVAQEEMVGTILEFAVSEETPTAECEGRMRKDVAASSPLTSRRVR